MGSSRERCSMAAQSSPTPPRRRPSAALHGPLCSHPYAPSASTPSPSHSDSRNGWYEPQLHHRQLLHKQQQQQQQQEEEVQHLRSRRGSDRVSHFAVVDDASTALQQQCETTRLLSRLLAGVTLQWRRVVEHLNDAQVPLATEQLAAQRRSTTDATDAAASPFARSGTTDRASNSTITYLHEGLRFDVQAHAQRRTREGRQPSPVDSPFPEKREVAHPYYNDGRRSRSRAARQQLALYMDAEAAETEVKERREAERRAAAVADWTAFIPSAEWVPYVVGKSTATNSSSRKKTKDVADLSDTLPEDRYDGVLYAATTSPLQRRYPSVRNGVSQRCVGCEAAAQHGEFDPDDESRLRTAVLHGMARSAETMILGMRQVQQVLSTAAAANGGGVVSPVRAPSIHNRDAATSLPRRERQQRTRSASSRRHRSPSPPLFSKRSHNSGLTADNTAQSGKVHVICPAPPVAQRTQIYPKGEAVYVKGRGERGGRRESVCRVSPPTKRTNDPPHQQHGITFTPPQARNSQPAPSTHNKNTSSSPELQGVEPIVADSAAVSLAAADRSAEARAPPNDVSRSYVTVSSPAPVQRYPDWRGTPTTARSNSSSNQGAAAELRAALTADGDVPAAERSVTPQRVRRGRGLAAVMPVEEAARLLHGLRTAALLHAESEDRLQLALSHERGTQALLQAHYHTLWKVQRGAAEKPRRGQRHTLEQSGTPASPLLASVSVSPFSSPSMSPSASPIAPALGSVGDVDHHQNSSSGSTATATMRTPPYVVSQADTQSDIAFTVSPVDVERVETIDLVCHSVAGDPRLSPTPPPRELFAPTVDADDSPPPPSTHRASRPPPPPPPSPPAEARRPPTPALESPSNELPKIFEAIPPRNHDAPSPSASRKVAAEVRSSPSPAARHRGFRRHFIEDALPISICDRGALVALELFPKNSLEAEEKKEVGAEEPLPVCDDVVSLPPPPPQQLPSALLETREVLDNNDVLTVRDVRRRSGISDYQASLNVQEPATSQRRRKETRPTLVAPSADVEGGTGSVTVLKSVSTSPLPLFVGPHSPSPETATLAAQSRGSAGGGSASTSICFDVESASPLENETALIVEGEDEEVGEAVTTYSSISSFRSALRDGFHSVGEAALGISASALTPPHVDSGTAAAAQSDAAPVLDQTCLVDAESANQQEMAPSPPPRPPTL